MKTHLFRLESLVPNGVGGPEAGAINLIYSFLLREFELNVYSHIHINQVGADLNELILKDGKKIHANIRYPAVVDFELKSTREKNLIRLDLVHLALLRIAGHDKKLSIEKLEAIKDKIVKENFSFDLVYKTHVYKKDPTLSAKIIIHPQENKFDFYVLFEQSGHPKCKQFLYSGVTDDYYIDGLFFYGKWKSENLFILSGKEKEVEMHVFIKECRVEFKNLTAYKKPPFFEMMKAGLPAPDKEKAYKDWLHSLPPGIAAIITYEPN